MTDSGPTAGNKKRGFIRLYRSQFDNGDALWKRSRKKSYWEAWQLILTLANYHDEPSEVVVRGQVVKVARGEFLASQRELAARLGWGRQEVRTFLKVIQNLHRIQPGDQPGVGLYKLCNYASYNGGDDGANPLTNPPTNPLPTHIQPYSRTKERKKKSQTAAKPPCDDLISAWNELAGEHGLPKIRQFTKRRAAALRARWRDKDWRRSWRQALGLIPSRPFLLGKSDRGWRADIDWFLRPDSVNAILEGKYAGPPPKPSPRERPMEVV